jgi:hypothetical protein
MVNKLVNKNFKIIKIFFGKLTSVMVYMLKLKIKSKYPTNSMLGQVTTQC